MRTQLLAAQVAQVATLFMGAAEADVLQAAAQAVLAAQAREAATAAKEETRPVQQQVRNLVVAAAVLQTTERPVMAVLVSAVSGA